MPIVSLSYPKTEFFSLGMAKRTAKLLPSLPKLQSQPKKSDLKKTQNHIWIINQKRIDKCDYLIVNDSITEIFCHTIL